MNRAAARLARDETDWARLYREGLRVHAGASEASAFVVPFEPDRDLVVVLVPCPKSMTAPVRESLRAAASLAHGGGLWSWLGQFGRILR